MAAGGTVVATASTEATAQPSGVPGEAAPTERTPVEPDGGGNEPPGEAPAPPPMVSLSGGVDAVLLSKGEGKTIWRHGRSARGPIDETTYLVGVSGAGATNARLELGFSAGAFLPDLRVGTYPPSRTAASTAAIWARTERTTATPDIEWGAERDARPSPGRVTIVLTSIVESDRSVERQGAMTLETTTFRIHGTIEASLPCARSIPAYRSICRTEVVRGTF
jgi:hypothetical protein